MNEWLIAWMLRAPVLAALTGSGPIVECTDSGLYSIDECTAFAGNGGGGTPTPSWLSVPAVIAVAVFIVWWSVEYVRSTLADRRVRQARRAARGSDR